MKHPLSKIDKTNWDFSVKFSFFLLNATRAEELPQRPKPGKNYEYWPDGAITAEGTPTYGLIRLGSREDLMISFCGGGVSIDEYTAAHPGKLGGGEPNFYATEPFASDLLMHFGTNGRSKKNPFRDWSILLLPYTTGDFHCGRNDYPYSDMNGDSAILHHHGYENTRLLLQKIKELVPSPKRLIITGFSAGAFGTSLLADDIMNYFPDCRDVTVIVDSAIMRHDWQPVARDVWKTPEEICARLTGSEIVSDSLIALHHNRPEAKIMFCCSKRDFALTQWTGFLEENGNWKPTKETGDRFQEHLREMIARLQKEIPDIGIFIFNTPNKDFEKEELTTHCICGSGAAFTVSEDGITVARWMELGVEGKLLQLGLENLNQ